MVDTPDDLEANNGLDTEIPASEEAPRSEADSVPESMLDAVLAAVNPTEDDDLLETDKPKSDEGSSAPESQDSEQEASSDEEPVKAEAEADSDDDAEDETEAELAAMNAKQRRAYEKRKRRFDRLRSRISKQEAELEEYRSYKNEISQSGIQTEDRDLLYKIGQTLQRGDFETFLQAVEPYYQLAMEATGRKLPDDLQNQVDDGYLPQETAQELVRAKYDAQLARREASSYQQHYQAAQSQQQTAALQRVVADWETQMKARDPDYLHKADDVKAEATKMVALYGAPQTAEQVIDYANRAYQTVNNLAAKYAAHSKATRPTPSSSPRSNSHQVRTAPTNMLEAVMQGLSGSK